MSDQHKFHNNTKKKIKIKKDCKVLIRKSMIYALEMLNISKQNPKHSRAVTSQCNSSPKR